MLVKRIRTADCFHVLVPSFARLRMNENDPGKSRPVDSQRRIGVVSAATHIQLTPLSTQVSVKRPRFR